MRAAGKPSSSARAAKPGASAATTSVRASTSCCPSAATCSVHGPLAPFTTEPDPAGPFAEPNELRIGPSARRKALGSHVQRLEQVRLAGAVRPDDEHQSRLEVEVEASVRPDVAQRNRADDQPGRLPSLSFSGSATARVVLIPATGSA